MTRRGFTLMEIVVAVTLTGIVALLVTELFRVVQGGAAESEAHRVALDRRMNASRWLGQALLSVDVDGPGIVPFQGDSVTMRWSSWLPGVHGWAEPALLSLALQDSTVRVQSGSAAPIALWGAIAELHVDYLLSPGAESGWVDRWGALASLPAAIRLRLRHAGGDVTDTLLFALGARG